MEGQQVNYDFLNLSNNYSIKNYVTRDEEIQFSDEVEKINKYGLKQTRNMILTENAMYNLKKTTLKRRIDYKTIIGITVSKNSDEFVIHCQDIEYDYHFVSPRKVLIIEIIAKNYVLIKEEELKLFEMEDKSLSNYVTTKKEKEKQQKVTRMPKTGQILVKDYLYKNQKKMNDIKSDKKIRKGNIKIVEVQPYDFDIIKTIGRGSVLIPNENDKIRKEIKSIYKKDLFLQQINKKVKNYIQDNQKIGGGGGIKDIDESDISNSESKIINLKQPKNESKFFEKIIDNSNENNNLDIKIEEKILILTNDAKNAITLHFQSCNQTLNYAVTCKIRERFSVIVGEILDREPEFQENDFYFLCNGSKIKEYQTIQENKLKDGDRIIIQTVK